MNINGVWKGEYVVHHHVYPTGKEVPVPFVVRIKATQHDKIITVDNGLFDGICQDDPVQSKVALHATIAGSLDRDKIYFVKQYPMLITQNAEGGVNTYDQPHPEIVFYGEWKEDKSFAGSWIMNRTFRKVNGRWVELMAMKGVWKMAKAD